MRKILIVLISVVLIGLFTYNFYSVFRSKVSKADIKGLAEEKVGEFFNARIKIGDIKVGLLKYISLSGLEINQEIQDKFFYLVGVKKIIFRYDLFSLFRTNLSQPNKISLDTPSIEFTKFRIPYQLFQRKLFPKRSNLFFEVENGTISYALPKLKTKFLVQNVEGSLSPLSKEVFSVSFAALGGGDLSGKIALSGICNSKDGSYDLSLDLAEIAITSSSFAPVKGLKGSVRIAANTIYIEDIAFYIRDIPIRVQGTISDFESEPVLDLKFAVETPHLISGFTVFGNSNDLRIKGNFILANSYHYLYQGELVLREGGLALQNMVINDHYTAQGDFSFTDGKYVLSVAKEDQEITFDFFHNDYTLSLDFALDHISFLNYDFVTVGKLRLEPALQFWTDNKLVMNATIDTDYMIFNYMPLQDFEGSFTISPHKIDKMNFKWGEVYELLGCVNLDEPRSVDVVLAADGLDLSNYESYAGVQLTDNLEALVEARTTINGPVSNPQIEGFVRSGTGRYREFTFDKTMINFYGDRYVLELKDSKILRNDKVFYIRGKIDFGKKNIFHDVLMESSEKIILWQGWDLSKDLGDDTITVKRKLTGGVDLSLHGKYRSDESDDQDRVQQGASLDYRYEDDQMISISFEDAHDDEVVALKHKIKF